MSVPIYQVSHEQCLKHVEEQLKLPDQKQNVCNYMHEYIIRKKANWSIELEKIHEQFINLSLELNRQQDIREVLPPYRQLTQNNNINSLEALLRHYHNRVEDIFNQKIKNYPEETIIALPDFESEESPEELIYISAGGKEKSERDEIKSLLRLKWECYKSIIETVKTNKKLEELWSSVIQESLKLCQQYKRRIELHRFVEQMRRDQQQLINREQYYQKYPNSVDITNTETNDLYISLRTEAYKICRGLDMWQDCFHLLEDIQLLGRQRKVQRKPSDRANYYQFLSEVFWHAKYYNYHSFFFLQHYILFKRKPGVTIEDMREKTDQLLLGLLSIPSNPVEYQQQYWLSLENSAKISQLMLGGGGAPIRKRDELVKDIQQLNLMDQASEPVRYIFNIIEGDFNLVKFTKDITSILENFKKLTNYEQYFKLVEQNIVHKVLKSIAKIYKTLKIDNLAKMLSFIPSVQFEKILLQANNNKLISCRIDHSRRIIIFSQKGPNDYLDASTQIVSLAQNAKILARKIECDNSDSQAQQQQQLTPKYSQQQTKNISPAQIQAVRQYIADASRTVQERINCINKTKRDDHLRGQQKQQQQEMEIERREELYEKEKLEKLQREKEMQDAVERQQREEQKQKEKKIQEIIKLKGSQVVKIDMKKIESLTEEDIHNITMEKLEELKTTILAQQKEDESKKYKSTFQRLDYILREKRIYEARKIDQAAKLADDEIKNTFIKCEENFKKKQETKQQFQPSKDFKDRVFDQVLKDRKEKYQQQITSYKEDIEKDYKQKIVELANVLMKEELKRLEEEKANKEAQQQRELQEQQKKNDKFKQESQQWRIKAASSQPAANAPANKPFQEVKPVDPNQWRSTTGSSTQQANTQQQQTQNQDKEETKIQRPPAKITQQSSDNTSNMWDRDDQQISRAEEKPKPQPQSRFQNVGSVGGENKMMRSTMRSNVDQQSQPTSQQQQQQQQQPQSQIGGLRQRPADMKPKKDDKQPEKTMNFRNKK